MSLPSLDIPRLLRQYGLHPIKSLGQNFLLDEFALQKVIDAGQIAADDAVLEIGPGLGSLTRHLAIHSRRVVAVELDANLVPILRDIVAPYPNVTVMQGDILAINLSKVFPEPDYLVVANIPYYITSALVRHLLESQRAPKRIVLTIQQEVAQRMCAEPGEMSLLALSVQVYGDPEIIGSIPASSFYPSPNVDSSIIRIDRFASPLIPPDRLGQFFQLIKAGFSQKRKTLRNALAAGLHLSALSVEERLNHAGIDPMRRAETLSVVEWDHLTLEFNLKESNP